MIEPDDARRDLDLLRVMLEGGEGSEVSHNIIEYMNSCPVLETKDLLIQYINSSSDPYLQSRALYALMRLKEFDQVGYLCSMLNANMHGGWRIAFCEDLTMFSDERVIPALCGVLLSDKDSDVRFIAAKELGKVGDVSAIHALEYAADHDIGADYEGRPISDEAGKAIELIRTRLGQRRDNSQ